MRFSHDTTFYPPHPNHYSTHHCKARVMKNTQFSNYCLAERDALAGALESASV
jgi:hypothetical protein